MSGVTQKPIEGHTSHTVLTGPNWCRQTGVHTGKITVGTTCYWEERQWEDGMRMGLGKSLDDGWRQQEWACMWLSPFTQYSFWLNRLE